MDNHRAEPLPSGGPACPAFLDLALRSQSVALLGLGEGDDLNSTVESSRQFRDLVWRQVCIDAGAAVVQGCEAEPALGRGEQCDVDGPRAVDTQGIPLLVIGGIDQDAHGPVALGQRVLLSLVPSQPGLGSVHLGGQPTQPAVVDGINEGNGGHRARDIEQCLTGPDHCRAVLDVGQQYIRLSAGHSLMM